MTKAQRARRQAVGITAFTFGAAYIFTGLHYQFGAIGFVVELLLIFLGAILYLDARPD